MNFDDNPDFVKVRERVYVDDNKEINDMIKELFGEATTGKQIGVRRKDDKR